MKRRSAASQKLPQEETRLAYRILILIIAILIVLSALLLFFQIRDVRCEGNYLYTEQQIIDASGICIGDNLAAIRKAKSAGMILSSLPFVDSVHIDRQIPHTVVIYVTESEASYVIPAEEKNYYLIDGEGVLEGMVTSSVASDYPLITGILADSPAIGSRLFECTSDKDAVEVLDQLIRYLDLYGVTGGVKSVNLTALNDISLNYDGRYDVYLGDIDELEYKIASFANMIETWDTGLSGIVDLTFDVDKTARFQPY